MDWDQISRNWDEMTLRIQPQSRLQSSGLSGGKGALSVDKGGRAPTSQLVGRADPKNDAIAADTLM
jgi:hypothetical protein